MIIDFHTHTFPATISLKAADKLAHMAMSKYFIDPNVVSLGEARERAGIDFCVNLPVMTRPDQVVPVNDSLIRQAEDMRARGIITFGGMHPDFEQYASELKRLKEHGIKGIKIHPAYQETDLNDIKFKRIIAVAEENDLAVITHAGLDIGYLFHNFADPDMIQDIINDIAPSKFVLAHMGGWQGWSDVENYLAGAPVYLDTAFSLGKITPLEGCEDKLQYRENLCTDDFVKLCRKHGCNKILFATDSPWAEMKEYVDFINSAQLTEEEKNMIYGGNAAVILGINNK